MALTNNLHAGRGLVLETAQPSAPRVDPNITVGVGKQVNAAQIVMGHARELNTDGSSSVVSRREFS